MVEFDKKRGPSRPFANIDEHDSALINGINNTCSGDDTLYVLGDVAMNSKYLHLLRQVNCRMHLVEGNHDIEDTQTYARHFYRVSGSRIFENFIATHIPIHPMELTRFNVNVNVHGHLHNGIVRYDNGYKNPRYMCFHGTDRV